MARKDIFVQIDKDIKKIESKISEVAGEVAQMFYDKLIENIRKNKFGFSISDITRRLRKRYGSSSSMPLIASGEYLQSIILEGTKVAVRQGMHKGGLTFNELSYILEYGRRDKHSPPFPVWKLTYEQIKKDMFKLANDKIKGLKN